MDNQQTIAFACPNSPAQLNMRNSRGGKYQHRNVPGATEDVSSAGVVPYVTEQVWQSSFSDGVHLGAGPGSGVFVLLQVEDGEDKGGWKPSLANFGGKVGPPDNHWVEAATRELGEEAGLGEFTDLLLTRIASVPPPELPSKLGASSVYVVVSKYEVPSGA
jgi:hypothetical protein